MAKDIIKPYMHTNQGIKAIFIPIFPVLALLLFYLMDLIFNYAHLLLVCGACQ